MCVGVFSFGCGVCCVVLHCVVVCWYVVLCCVVLRCLVDPLSVDGGRPNGGRLCLSHFVSFCLGVSRFVSCLV